MGKFCLSKIKSVLSHNLIMVLFFSIVSIVCFLGLTTQSAEAAPPSDGTTWTQDTSKSDEFSGTSIDTTKWGIDNLWYSSTGAATWKDSNISVSGGYLNLQFKKETYNGFSYTSAAVQSNFDVPGQISYVEVSAKMTNFSSNICSEIWLYKQESTAMNPNPETDVQESCAYGNSYLSSHLHEWPRSPDSHIDLGGNSYNTGVNLDAAFHTYGLERKNGVLYFYFDGTLAWQTSPSDQSFYTFGRHLILDLENWNGAPVDAYLPATMQVDYVRTYTGTSSGSTRVDDGGTGTSYTGTGWGQTADSSCYGGNQHYSNVTNDYAQFTFTGTSVDFGYTKSTDRGKADVYLDGTFKQTIDYYNSSTQYQQIMYSISGLSNGSHTLKIVNNGTRNASSTGNYIGVDFFDYTGSGGGGTNLVSNPSFEADGDTQTPSGWSKWSPGTDLDASFTQTYGGAHTGSEHATQYKTSSYSVVTYQSMTGLANGTYTLTAWVKSSGGQSTAYLYAKNYGGIQLEANISAASTWTQISISNISVTSGTIEIGFSSVASAYQWLYFDDVSLTKN